ncbi:hypothetical protein E2C01_029927 [Portunus trituberculatus]|uniref:Uncharacterized protein n=1 Tax=Portunus trituberculatus TaxID=210409 RepID=A0A5B7ETR1_PORTR|nr:hypothetical protein [Portunus trituberculatus]
MQHLTTTQIHQAPIKKEEQIPLCLLAQIPNQSIIGLKTSQLSQWLQPKYQCRDSSTITTLNHNHCSNRQTNTNDFDNSSDDVRKW